MSRSRCASPRLAASVTGEISRKRAAAVAVAAAVACSCSRSRICRTSHVVCRTGVPTSVDRWASGLGGWRLTSPQRRHSSEVIGMPCRLAAAAGCRCTGHEGTSNSVFRHACPSYALVRLEALHALHLAASAAMQARGVRARSSVRTGAGLVHRREGPQPGAPGAPGAPGQERQESAGGARRRRFCASARPPAPCLGPLPRLPGVGQRSKCRRRRERRAHELSSALRVSPCTALSAQHLMHTGHWPLEQTPWPAARELPRTPNAHCIAGAGRASQAHDKVSGG